MIEEEADVRVAPAAGVQWTDGLPGRSALGRWAAGALESRQCAGSPGYPVTRWHGAGRVRGTFYPLIKLNRLE
ncbi:hypothetical protein [Alicyclobacillus dauci]|uniref:Uncharacterized protein n=1 Tax=Alicyclobacillus dauci TaxID=1475485 RepID=A0ABY6Z2Z9_9BACL|nr:hypothetical protein [Alicyclobacillus dauci]WAH37216.1 hypothetical protein NZD86_01305 [Alicyclobacillus dauci]